MWVLPKNYQTSLAFVPDTVALKEDLTLLESTIGSSLMWRSKPSPLQTWSRRWSRVSWMPHLFGRILKPSQHISFETALTSSLAAIRASRSARQARDRARTIPVTSGHTSDDMSEQLTLFSASSKTSKDTSRLDSTASSAIWQKMVTTQRGEYSQRKKSVRLIRESESSFLPTPSATPYGTSNNGQRGDGTTFKQAGKPSLESMARHNLWPTPTTSDSEGGPRKPDGKRGRALKDIPNPMWPTPRASEYKDCGPVGSKSHTHMDKRHYLCAKAKHPDQPTGCLNPAWVEWLMGVPTGWTELESWGTE